MRFLWPLLLWVAAGVHAQETGLAQICLVPASANQHATDCAAPAPTPWGKYARPLPTDLVMDCGVAMPGGQPAGICWAMPLYASISFRPFRDVPSDHAIIVCETSIQSDTPVPNPWSVAGDTCKAWRAVPKSQVLTSAIPGSPAATGGTSITWTAPTTNTDNSPLADLAGFRVYHGTQDPLAMLTTLGVGVVTYEAVNLPAGPNLFEVTAFNTAGRESDRSNRVTVLVQDLCGANPLKISSVSWPTARSGRRAMTYIANKEVTRFEYTWPVGGTQSVTFTDKDGCTFLRAR